MQLHLSTCGAREYSRRTVPEKVSYGDFWKRYFFRLHKLESIEKRRAAVLQSALSLSLSTCHYFYIFHILR